MNSHSNIEWIEWSNKVFEKAVVDNKPILLYLRAGWCSWCHQMEREALADPKVMHIINSFFIPVLVNTDERPDINLRYTMGGWPSVVILTAGGKVIAGSTYISREDLWKALSHCLHLYHHQREEVENRLRSIEEKTKPRIGTRNEHTTVPFDAVQQSLEFLKNDFDPLYGGFGREPKFPPYEAIDLAILAFSLGHPSDLIEKMLTCTLDRMSEGRIFDKEEGGFFRYAQRQDWSEPHYEKILVDNLWLLQNYLHAYMVTCREHYKTIAISILNYLDNQLYDHNQGIFWGSQRAEEQYYQLNRQDRQSLSSPSPEKVVYTSGNALAVSSYLKAAVVTSRDDYLQRARRLIEFLWHHYAPEEMGMLHGQNHHPSSTWRLLSDQVYMAKALLDCYQLFGEESFLSRALLLAEWLRAQFFDSTLGGFWDRTERGFPQGRLKERMKPIFDNALGAEFFFQLSLLTQNQSFAAIARRTLAFFSLDFSRYGLFASRYALACHQINHAPLLIIVIGKSDNELTQLFLRQVFSTYEPRKVMKLLDTREHPHLAELLEKQGYGEPRGYLYLGQSCQLETHDPCQLIQKIRDLSSKR